MKYRAFTSILFENVNNWETFGGLGRKDRENNLGFF
jgi:hypothetical protein